MHSQWNKVEFLQISFKCCCLILTYCTTQYLHLTRSNQIELMKILLNYSPFFTHPGSLKRSSLWKWEINLLLVVWIIKLIRFLFIYRSCGIWKVNWSRLQRRNILHNQVRLSARSYKLKLLMLYWETGLRIYMLRRHKLRFFPLY